MKTHLTVVGLIDILTGLFFIALAAFTTIGVVVFAPAFYGGPLWRPDDAKYVVAVVALVSIMFLTIGVPSVIIGIGLMKQKRWARVLAIIVAALLLTIPPLGTVAGLYSLWVLMQSTTGQALAAA